MIAILKIQGYEMLGTCPYSFAIVITASQQK